MSTKYFKIITCVFFITLSLIMLIKADQIIGIGDFEAKIGRENHFVLFYANWCPHCRNLLPVWGATEQMLSAKDKSLKQPAKNTNILKIDCQENVQLCATHLVHGYPTMRYYSPQKDPVFYKGARSTRALSDFIVRMENNVPPPWTNQFNQFTRKNLPVNENGVKMISDNSFRSGILNRGIYLVKFYAPWCGHCKVVKPYYAGLVNRELKVSVFNEDATTKRLNSEFLDVNIAEVNCDVEVSVCTILKIQGYPTIALFRNGLEVARYNRYFPDNSAYFDDEQMDLFGNDVSAFVDESVNELLKLLKSDDGKVPEMVLKEQHVMDLSPYHSFTGTPNIYFIKFYAPWCSHCRALAPVWEQLAIKLDNIRDRIRVGRMNCVDYPAICGEFQIRGYPTLVMIKVSEDQKNKCYRSIFWA